MKRRAFDNSFAGFFDNSWIGDFLNHMQPYHVTDTGIEVDAPGATRETVSIRLKGQTIVVSWRRGEGQRTSYIPLPDGVDPYGLKASVQDGVIRIVWPADRRPADLEIPVT